MATGTLAVATAPREGAPAIPSMPGNGRLLVASKVGVPFSTGSTFLAAAAPARLGGDCAYGEGATAGRTHGVLGAEELAAGVALAAATAPSVSIAPVGEGSMSPPLPALLLA